MSRENYKMPDQLKSVTMNFSIPKWQADILKQQPGYSQMIREALWRLYPDLFNFSLAKEKVDLKVKLTGGRLCPLLDLDWQTLGALVLKGDKPMWIGCDEWEWPDNDTSPTG